jgi:hypothetical protein
MTGVPPCMGWSTTQQCKHRSVRWTTYNNRSAWQTNFRSTRSTVRSNGRVVVLWFSHGVWHHRCPKFPLVGWWGIWRNPFNREMMIDGIPNWLAPLFLPKGHYSLTCCLFCNLLSKTQTFNFFPTQRGPLYRKINTAILVSYWYFTWTYLVADKFIV